jgi:hypothetical protein
MTDEQPKLGAFPYVVGGLSYIPLLGVLFGGAALIWGLVTKKSGGKRLAAIGAGGILLTVVLYGALFYFAVVQRGGIFDALRAKLTANTLTSLAQAIEVYRLQNGTYPDSLETLRQSLPKGSLAFVFDPTDVRMSGKSRYFYYEVVDADHYYLRCVGPDGEPFTADDIVPLVEVKPGSKIGLLTERVPAS